MLLFDGPCDGTVAGRVRRDIAAAADGMAAIPAAVREDLALIATELITNSLRAGAGRVQVTLQTPPPDIQLEVSDDGPGIPAIANPSASDTGGRGLMIVDRLADRWGHRPSTVGKTVWARLNTDGRGAPRRGGNLYE